MKNINPFIDKNLEIIYIIIGVIGLIVIGFIDDSLYAILKVLLGIIAFGIFIGLISSLIKVKSNEDKHY